jgi:hypothetical protein
MANKYDDYTKIQLLHILEHVPQYFWPPRPTRQVKSELIAALCAAERSGRYIFRQDHARTALT